MIIMRSSSPRPARTEIFAEGTLSSTVCSFSETLHGISSTSLVDFSTRNTWSATNPRSGTITNAELDTRQSGLLKGKIFKSEDCQLCQQTAHYLVKPKIFRPVLLYQRPDSMHDAGVPPTEFKNENAGSGMVLSESGDGARKVTSSPCNTPRHNFSSTKNASLKFGDSIVRTFRNSVHKPHFSFLSRHGYSARLSHVTESASEIRRALLLNHPVISSERCRLNKESIARPLKLSAPEIGDENIKSNEFPRADVYQSPIVNTDKAKMFDAVLSSQVDEVVINHGRWQEHSSKANSFLQLLFSQDYPFAQEGNQPSQHNPTSELLLPENQNLGIPLQFHSVSDQITEPCKTSAPSVVSDKNPGLSTVFPNMSEQKVSWVQNLSHQNRVSHTGHLHGASQCHLLQPTLCGVVAGQISAAHSTFYGGTDLFLGLHSRESYLGLQARENYLGLQASLSRESEENEERENRRYKCPYCDITCTNNGQLKGHVRVHTGEKPYRCDCGRAFARNEELTRHRRIHSGLRPHHCGTCGKRFGRKDHLNKHQKTHLRTCDKKIHVCHVTGCRQRYTRSDALARHQWGAHGIRARSYRSRPSTAANH